MRFSQDLIEKIREANSIVEIIGQHTELKGSGHRLMGRCPFPDHLDKSPSFSVNQDNQLFYCYGCKKGGNVFHFLQFYNGLSFPEAVEFLARRASIPLPEKEDFHGRKQGESREQKDVLLRINRLAAVFYHQQLKSLEIDHPAKLYLKKRGLSDEIVEVFRLGVSLGDWQGLYHHLQARKAPIAQAETLGLIKPKKVVRPDDTHFDLFRERLMFPIFSPSSDVIGFGGRTLGDGLPKYLNSSDSPVFNKSKVLYGLHETGKHIRAQDSAIVVEGYMDAISLYSAGIRNVVAILGTAFTPDHAKLLKRYTANVIMLLDGDEAGISGAERSLPVLLQAGLMPKGFVLPDKMDPDDYVKAQGADKLRAETERAPELFSLLLSRRWMQGYHGTPSDKVRVIEEAASALRGMQNKQLQDLYTFELARQLDVEMGWVRKALAAAMAGSTSNRPIVNSTASEESVVSSPVEEGEREEVDVRIELKSAPKDESFILSLLLNSEELMRELIEAGPEEVLRMVTHDGIKRAISEAVALYGANPAHFASLGANLASRVDQPAVLMSAQMVLNEGSSEGLARKLMSDYLGAVRQRYLKSQAKVLVGQLRDEASPAKLREFMTLQRDRLAPDREPSGE